uniref:Uncharacterized protein n=1 Tax=Lactuca sativa TaxID=4236 RepID=A0A9R1XFB6_LACSA|nr:hypothetical protein LSAT_V11C400194940 [Lactuca sativa]
MAQNNRDEIIFDKFNLFFFHLHATKIQATIKKNHIGSFEAVFVEGSLREISSFGMVQNKGDHMLVDHKHKNNSTKQPKFVDQMIFAVMVDPYNFVTFQDLIAKNLDTRVAFGKMYFDILLCPHVNIYCITHL